MDFAVGFDLVVAGVEAREHVSATCVGGVSFLTHGSCCCCCCCCWGFDDGLDWILG